MRGFTQDEVIAFLETRGWERSESSDDWCDRWHPDVVAMVRGSRVVAAVPDSLCDARLRHVDAIEEALTYDSVTRLDVLAAYAPAASPTRRAASRPLRWRRGSRRRRGCSRRGLGSRGHRLYPAARGVADPLPRGVDLGPLVVGVVGVVGAGVALAVGAQVS